MVEYNYKPYEERKVKEQYKNIIREINEKGIDHPSPMVDSKTGEPVSTRELDYGTVANFDILNEGAPIITERDISAFYKGAIGELFGFINGARTQEELEKYGCKWWKSWVTEEKCAKRGLETGDLGPGSYGAAFHDFPTASGETFNQFLEITKQMKERPELKTHFISPWIPQYTIRNQEHQQKVVVCPCHGWVHFQITDGKLNMRMFQRSCDIIVGCPSNWAQYSALLLAMSDVLNLKPGVFSHMISNAHIYSNSIDKLGNNVADLILSRETAPFPTLKLVNHHDSIFDYRPDDFELEDYHPKEKVLGIRVGV